MTDKQIIIDEVEINPNDWLEPYKPIPACEIKDCDHLVYAGDGILGCRIAEDGLVCDDFNNDDECCMYRQLEYYKEAFKRKEQECKELNNNNHTLLVTRQKLLNDLWIAEESLKDFKEICDKQCEQLEAYKMEAEEGKEINAELKAENDKLKNLNTRLDNQRETYWKGYKKLKQTLTEIKEIACRLPIGVTREQILQKISEVIE